MYNRERERDVYIYIYIHICSCVYVQVYHHLDNLRFNKLHMGLDIQMPCVFETCSFVCCFERNSEMQVAEMIVEPPYEGLLGLHALRRRQELCYTIIY